MSTRSQSVITLEAAQAVVDGCLAEAASMGVRIVVSVVDPAGHPVAMARMDGSPMLSIDVAAAKAWTVTAFGQPTSWWAGVLDSDPSLAALGGASPQFMPVPGGVPVSVGGELIGAVGVSGATAEEDEQVATAGAGAVGS